MVPKNKRLSFKSLQGIGLRGETSISDEALIVGLRHFLARWGGERLPLHAVSSFAGLANFLDKAAPLLPRSQVFVPLTAAPVMPSLEQFTAALASLHEPLQRSRENGDFLQIWSVAGIKRNELRNAAILAWLIDPRGSHGYGSDILSRLLSTAAEQVPCWPLHDADLSYVTVHTEERPLGSDRDRVDIAIDGPDFVLFMEVKIDAIEGRLQLRRYIESAKEKARALRKKHALVIYLSPRPPIDLPFGVVLLTWRHISRILSGVSSRGINGTLVHHYARHIRSFS